MSSCAMKSILFSIKNSSVNSHGASETICNVKYDTTHDIESTKRIKKNSENEPHQHICNDEPLHIALSRSSQCALFDFGLSYRCKCPQSGKHLERHSLPK